MTIQPTKLWTPRINDYGDSDGYAHNRPTKQEVMFGGTNVTHHSVDVMVDARTGTSYSMKDDLDSGDRESTNLHHAWKNDGGTSYGYFGCDVKMQHRSCDHIGMNPYIHTKSQIKAESRHITAGAYGVYFLYNWPSDDSLNYWTNSPHGIETMFLHYYNANDDTLFSHHAYCQGCSTSNKNLWINTWVEDDDRSSDSMWHRATYIIENSTARQQVQDNRHVLIGMSIRSRYQQRGGKHRLRGWRMMNLNPIYGGSSSWKQYFAKQPLNGGGAYKLEEVL